MEQYFAYLKILGINKNIPLQEIKIIYRKLVKEQHPDKFTDRNLKIQATNNLKKINEAYDYIVSNYEFYKDYDELDEIQESIYEDIEEDLYEDTFYQEFDFKYETDLEYKIPLLIKTLIYSIIFIIFNIIYFKYIL